MCVNTSQGNQSLKRLCEVR